LSTPTVHILGLDIPVFDYLTIEEQERVELLTADKPASTTRFYLELLRIFADTRCGEKIRVDEYLKKPDPNDQLAAGLEEVMRPFTEAREERNKRHQARIARGLTLNQVAAVAMDLKAQVEILETAVSELEANGGELKP